MIAATPYGGEGHHGSLGAERARGSPGRRDRAAARTTPWEEPSASPRALSVAAYPMTIDIESLYRKHGPMVSRRCQYLLGDQMAAMDTMQDVFVELLRRRECLDASAPVGLILTIARNLCLNRLRSRRRRSEHPDGQALLEIVNRENDSNPEDRALARRVLDRLFHHHADSARLIASLYHVEHMTWRAQVPGYATSWAIPAGSRRASCSKIQAEERDANPRGLERYRRSCGGRGKV